MSQAEYRCGCRVPGCACNALLFRSAADHGRLEIVCWRCGHRKTVYLGGYRRLPHLAPVRSEQITA